MLKLTHVIAIIFIERCDLSASPHHATAQHPRRPVSSLQQWDRSTPSDLFGQRSPLVRFAYALFYAVAPLSCLLAPQHIA